MILIYTNNKSNRFKPKTVSSQKHIYNKLFFLNLKQTKEKDDMAYGE